MSDRARQKELKLAYKLAHPPMGLFAIRNLATGRVFVDRSRNLTGSLNRHRMELQRGVHRNRELMADWRTFGEARFAFEVVARVAERPEPDFDYEAALDDCLATWREGVPPGSPGSYT